MPSALEFEVFTLFPELVLTFADTGLMAKAKKTGRLRINATNYRDFTHDTHKTVDEMPFGGGAGMLIKAEPVVAALEHVEQERGPFHRILLTPSAPPFDQRAAERLAKLPRIGLLCGRYEGIDDRVRENFVDECFSLGDFVLNGGEVAALAIIEAVARLREGVLGNAQSVETESFGDADNGALLEHPHYTRPASFRGLEVPPVLLGGDHQAIALWRARAARARTWRIRPELRRRVWACAEREIWLAVSEEIPSAFAAELESLCADAPAGRVHVAHGRGPRDLRKSVRRRSGAAGVVAAVGHSEETGLWPAPDVPELMDLVAAADGEEGPARPLILAAPFSYAAALGAELSLDLPVSSTTYAQSTQVGISPLASGERIVESSQPRGDGDLVAKVRRLSQALADHIRGPEMTPGKTGEETP